MEQLIKDRKAKFKHVDTTIRNSVIGPLAVNLLVIESSWHFVIRVKTTTAKVQNICNQQMEIIAFICKFSLLFSGRQVLSLTVK